MRFVRIVLLLGAACGLTANACDGCDGGEQGPENGCTLDNGDVIGVGESGPAADGCNTCLCRPDFELACTSSPCEDAGPEGQEGEGEGEGVGEGEGEGEGEDEGPCVDADDDGYHRCIDPNFPDRPLEVDCDDERFHVQPNGIEFPDTPEDDNCNGANDDYVECGCNIGNSTEPRDIASAMDLCGEVVASATKDGAPQQFGIVDEYQGTIGERVRVRIDDPDAPTVVIGNECLATLSTGNATSVESDVSATDCNYTDPDPAGPNPETEICDLAQLRLTLRAPPNAQGFAFDFMFLSYEWPEYLCLEFNDTFYAIVETDAVFTGIPTNAAFDSNGRPITVNVGFFEEPVVWTVPLDGLSHAEDAFGGCPAPTAPGCQLPAYCSNPLLDIRRGSGSGWLTTTVPVTPGQQDVNLTLSIHDEADQVFDSIVLLDNFRWLNLPTDLETAKEDR